MCDQEKGGGKIAFLPTQQKKLLLSNKPSGYRKSTDSRSTLGRVVWIGFVALPGLSTLSLSTLEMFSRQTTQDALAFMFVEDVKFSMLFERLTQKNTSFPYWSQDRFDLTRVTDEERKAEFRFGLAELPLSAKVLAIPDTFVCRNGTVATGMEGLCILLRRFAYPCRLSDLIPRFGRSVLELSEITSEVSSYTFVNYEYTLQSLNQPWLQPDCLQSFADAISGRGSALSNCWGFVDGTVRPIARPGDTRECYTMGIKGFMH